MGRETTLYVYSSHRSLMQNSNEGEIFAPSMMMGDFFTQLIIIDGYRALPRGMRLPLVMSVLKECAKELERAKFICRCRTCNRTSHYSSHCGALNSTRLWSLFCSGRSTRGAEFRIRSDFRST